MRRFTLALILLAAAAGLSPGQDKVKYRERGTKGGESTATGKIESESLAGVKVGNKTIPSGDIVEVTYDLPGELKPDYYRAAGEEVKNPANAAKEFEALLKNPRVKDSRTLRRYFEYKVALIAAGRADDSTEAMQRAIDALSKFRKDHGDSWQVVPATRLLGRMLTAKEPPDPDGARKVYEELSAAKDVPADVKLECTFLAIDLLIQAGKSEEARAKVKTLPKTDPRVLLYEIGATAESTDAAVRKLEEYVEKTSDAPLKAAAYNMIGDVYRRDPKHKKDALYAYLKVDLLYNQDPAEAQKAVLRLADLFQELKDDDRARKYRDKARGK